MNRGLWPTPQPQGIWLRNAGIAAAALASGAIITATAVVSAASFVLDLIDEQ
jgi:hypothetical protein